MSELANEQGGEAMGNCQVCGASRPHWPRYPNRLCERCVEAATDEGGRGLEFRNEDLWGGVSAWRRDSGERVENPIKGPGQGIMCRVSGVDCVAREARMGGIVVELAGGAGR